ncbi:MAG TPA: ATP-binding protein [Streptosporangiaceae bacterium]|nr:ATP-binding protein [Streptosporangiaceae bacterium]
MALAVRAERPAVLVTAWFPGRSAEVKHAREFVRGVLGAEWPVLDDVLLMVSEVASNAVRHTASADEGGSFDLTVTADADTLRIAIADRGSSAEPCLRDGGREMSTLTGGRGLQIVDALASSRGHTGDELGRVVWFEVTVKAEL